MGAGSSAEDHEGQGRAALAEFGLAALAERDPRDLSAGERQRGALAVILAGNPAIALLDEPTRGMDELARRSLARVLDRLRAQGCSVVVATHDLDLVAEIADRVVSIEDGIVVERSTPAGAELEARAVRPQGVKVCGVMADLVPPAEIARITRLLGAPYGNTFGATETGWPPASSNNIPVGVAPARLSKEQSPFCEVKLVDSADAEVPDGAPGELCMRGPTLFSGYFRAEAVNAQEFRGGWFHLGDVFVRNPDGTLDFVDRVKYLIKSGGENIYPAEIERLILQDPRVAEAAVVRAPDAKWGEVPVAFVARRDPALTEADLFRLCRTGLAGYKQPKQIRFISVDEFPRSASGKIQRHELEKLTSKV